MTPLEILELAGCIALPLLGGMLGSLLSRSQIDTWYRQLKKAPWNPPDWAFGVVWSILYVCMGVSSWLVIRHAGLLSLPMYLYAAQLLLNWTYTPLFFVAHKVALSSFNILASLGLVMACAIAFYPISLPAAGLLLPLLAWLLVALSLNLYILLNNPRPADDIEAEKQRARLLDDHLIEA